MKNLFCLIVISLFAYSSALIGQTILLGNPNPDAFNTCITIQAGVLVDFAKDPSSNTDPEYCSPDVIISDVMMPAVGGELLRTSADEFSFTFDEPGQYFIFCGVPAEAAGPVLCITVPEIVPTLSQWSVIILFLLLAITVTVAFKSWKQVDLSLEKI